MQATKKRTLKARLEAFIYRWEDELIIIALICLLIIASAEPIGA